MAYEYSLCPEEMEPFWSETEKYSVDSETNLDAGLSELYQKALDSGGSLFRESAKIGVRLLAVVLLCGVSESLCLSKRNLSVVQAAGALTITSMSVGNVKTMIGLGRDTISAMEDFANVLLPAMAIVTAAEGKVRASAIRNGTTVLFVRLLISAIDRFIIPIIYASLACCFSYAVLGNEGLKRLGKVLKGAAVLSITGILIGFVAYMTLTGAIAGSADAAAVRAAKIAITRVIPVVGGILADTAESVLVGAGILKGTVGTAGLLVVAGICIIPFLKLSFQYLAYKLAAAVTAAVANKQLSGLLDEIGGAFGLILGMTGACALLLLFSLVSAVAGVT